MPIDKPDSRTTLRLYERIEELEHQLAYADKNIVQLVSQRRELLGRIEELDRQIVECQKDAQRYRALFAVPRSITMPVIVPSHPNYTSMIQIGYSSKEGADRDIDAATPADPATPE